MGSKKSRETLEQVLLNGVAGGGTARGDAELVVDGGEMPVDGARSDAEVLGDLGVGEALSNKTEHFDLAFGHANGIGRSFWRV